MSNKDKYKKVFSVFKPSESAVEKVYDMTIDNKKIVKNPWLRRIIACVMVFAIVIGSGFGINSVVNKPNDDLGVIVAYASGDTFKVGSRNEQKLFYGIYVMPEDNLELREKVYNRWNEDVNKIMNKCKDLGESGISAICGKGSSTYENVQINHIMGGSFALSLEDYSEVKTFKVENSGEYGLLMLDYLISEEHQKEIDELVSKIDDSAEYNPIQDDINMILGMEHEFIISGDDLRRSKDSGLYKYEGGANNIDNCGYLLKWEMSPELIEAIENDPYFDLTQVKDTITFTVEFNDGTVKTASINLYFDADGYMHFADE